MKMLDWKVMTLTSLAALAATAFTPGWAPAQERVVEWQWHMHPIWGVWGIGMMLMVLTFWALIIVAIVLGIRWMLRAGGGPERDTAMDLLRERYARGEINREEFEARKRDLSR